MINNNEAQKLWDLVEPLKTAMLVTSVDQVLQARPMQLVQSDFDGTFYFFTTVPSPKINEIQDEDDVCLSFSCPKDEVYVSVSGQASLVRDQRLINELWNPMVAAWFPQGKDDPSVGLIQVRSYQAEYWEQKGGTLTQLYKYAKATIMGKQPDAGYHGQMK